MRMDYRSFEELPAMLTAEELAGALGISRAGAYALIHSKGFPTLRIGKRLMVPKDTTSPRGRDNTSVTAKSSILSRKPSSRVMVTVWNDMFSLLCPTRTRGRGHIPPASCVGTFYWLASSRSASSYLTASSLRVPSSMSSCMAWFTAAVRSEPWRKPMPYSSTDSSRSGMTIRSE